MADYRISLGVDVNTEGLQDKVNAAANNLKPIKLDVELGDIKKELKSITSELKTLNSKKLLNIDTSTINSLKNVDSIIKNIKTSINSVGQSGNGFDRVSNDIKQVTASIKNAEDITAHMKKAFNAIDIDFKGADVVTKDLEKMNLEIQKVTTKISGNNIDVSVTGIEKTADGLERIVTASKKYSDAIVNTENVNKTITQTFSTSADVLKRTQKENANTVKEINKEMNNFVKLQGKIGQMKTKIGELELAGGKTNQVTELKRQLEELETTYDSLMQKFMKKMTANADVIPMDDVIKFDDNIEAETKKVENALRELDAKVKDSRANIASGIKGNFSGDEAQIERLIERFEKLSRKPVEVQNGINNLKSTLADMKAASNDEDLIEAAKKYKTILKETESQLRKNEAIEKQVNNSDNLTIAKQNALLKLKGLFEENSEAAKKFGSDVQRLQAELDECGNIDGVNKINKQISNLGLEIKNSGLQTKTFGSKLKAQFDKYKDYLSVASIFMYVSQGVRDMFDQVVAIDSAMTELKKVTNETDSSYNQFLSNVASRAKEIGTTIDGLVDSTAEFAKLGYSFEESQGLAEVANIYAVVGDEIDSVEGATESLVSTLAAFKHEMGDMSDTDFAMSIVDKMNEVANRYSIGSGGIGEALKRSASSLAAANNTLDESIALITAANEVTQDPEKVGNAMKTISMRIRGAKTELEEAGESTDGMVESTAKLREEIIALSGVDIMENENTFKSTYQIMDELSQKWENLSDIAQASIIELLAGKHQGNVMSSLMANFDVARAALETSATSSGSAMREHAKWSDSLEARLNKLKSTWQSLSQSFLSSDFLKGGISALTGFVDVLDGLISKFGTLPTLLTGFSLFNSLFNKDSMLNVFKTFNTDLDGFINKTGIASKSFAEIIQAFKAGKSGNGLKGFFSGLSSVGNIFKNTLSDIDISNIQAYNNLIDEGVTAQTAWNRTMQSSSAAAKNIVAGANGGKVAMQGLTAAANTSKVAMFGLSLAATAMNAALTMGISALISWGVSALSKWINQAEELAEKVDEVTSKYKEQHDSLTKLKNDYDTTNEDSMISRYGELSKGVDAFGRNLSLTADEYAEYQNIVSTIADQIPSLVSGYDSQGNAILSCAGNVEQLTKAYEDLIKAQNNEVLVSSNKDITDDFQNAVKDAEHNTEGWFGGANWTKNLNLGASKLSTESAEVFENILNSNDALNEFNKEFGNAEANLDRELLTDIDAMSKLLEDAGFDKNGKWYNQESDIEHVRRAFEENKAKVKDVLDQYYADLEVEAEGKKTQAQAALSNALDLSDSMYYGMSDTMKNIAKQTVGGFNFEFFEGLKDQGISVEEYINNMLNALNSLSNVEQTDVEAAFNLRTQFNDGDISYGEYVSSIQEVGNLIDNLSLPDEVKTSIKNALNLDGVIEQYNTLSKRLQDDFGFDKNIAGNFLSSLSSDEFSILMDIIPEIDSNATISDIQAMIDKEMAMRGLNVKLDINVEKANIDAVTTALSEMVTGAGMSSESISAVEGMFKNLRGYDPSKLFERTANGIRLNREEFGKLNSDYQKTNIAELNQEMSNLGNVYNQTREELYKLTYGTDEYNEKAKELSTIEKKINATEKLIAQYKGLTSAYQQWQIAESSGNERDMYESVIAGFNTVKDELSRGWIDDGTVEFIQLLKGETATIIDGNGVAKEIDIATASAKELKQVWDDLDKTIEHTAEGGSKGYSIRDFFTVDDEGNSTSKGVYNFLDALGHMEEEVFGGKDIVQRDSKGNIIGFDFKLVGGNEVIAEALGVSEELVEIMVRAADDAGFVVSFDGTYQQLDVLREKAQLAAESMNKILGEDKKINIDMNADSVKEIQPQIDSIMKVFGKRDGSGKLTGSIDMSIKGSEDALTVVSTLQSMKDRLERPSYMDIQVSQVEDDLQEPLRNLQDYRTNIERLNQAKLHGADTTELEASIEESKNKVVEDLLEIQETNPELAAQLKIEGLSREEILKKVETGKIEIPASIDIQLEMDEKLGILVDKMLLDSGYISPEEFEKRVYIYLDAEIDNEDAKKNVKESVNNIIDDGDKSSVTTQTNVEVEAGSVEITKVSKKVENKIAEGAVGKKKYSIGTVDVDADKADASGVAETAEEAIKEDAGDGETVTLNKDVQFEFNINDYVDELSKFKDVAKELEGLEDISVKINVNLEGELKSSDVSNLEAFAAGAKELQGVWNKDNTVSVSVAFKSDIEGDMSLDDLTSFADGANALKNTKDVTNVSVTANLTSNLGEFKGNIDDLITFAEGANALNNTKGEISVSVSASIGEGFPDSTAISNLKKFADAANALPKGAITVSVKANVDTNSINNAITLLERVSSSGLFKDYKATVTATVNYDKGEQKEPEDKTVKVNYELGTQANPENKTAKVNYELGTQANPKSKTVYVDYVERGTAAGTAHVNGSAFANGSTGRAFARGDWGIKGNGVALGGELGRRYCDHT